MKLGQLSKYAAMPARIVTTVVVFLFIVAALQTITLEVSYEISKMLRPLRRRTRPVQETVQPVAKEPTEQEKRLTRIRNSSKQFLPDGTIHLVHNLGYTLGRMDIPAKEQIYDVNDNLLWEGPAKDSPYKYLSWPTRNNRRYTIMERFNGRQMKQMQMIMPEFSQTLEIFVSSGEKIIQIWRYHPAKDYFIGYGSNGKKVGYIGSTGFTDSESKVKPFGKFRLFAAWGPQDSFGRTLLWQTNNRIYEISFEKQRVDVIFESIEEDITWMHLYEGGFDEHQVSKASRIYYRPFVRCVTEVGKHHLIIRQPEQKLTITIPEDWKNWIGNYYWFTSTKQGIFLRRDWIQVRFPPDYSSWSLQLRQQWDRNYRSRPQRHWVELYKVDAKGGLKLLNHYDWIVHGRPERGIRYTYKDLSTIIRRYVSAFSPPLYWYLSVGKMWRFVRQQSNELVRDLVGVIVWLRPGSGILNWVLSVLMMGLAFLHGWPRLTSWARFAFWLVFVGIFNLAGLLTYLALNHTVVIKCPVCGKRRGLAQVDCVRCQAELPAPERGKLDLILST